ncbi:tetratricopeptide repeat protein, partial [Waterburya agarophytonicola K14]
MSNNDAIANYDDWVKVYDLGESYQQQQQWQQAAIFFHKAIQLRPDFFWSYHHLADALTKLQQWDRAVLVYRRA